MRDALHVQRPRLLHPVELMTFHSEDYVDFLARVTPDNQVPCLPIPCVTASADCHTSCLV